MGRWQTEEREQTWRRLLKGTNYQRFRPIKLGHCKVILYFRACECLTRTNSTSSVFLKIKPRIIQFRGRTLNMLICTCMLQTLSVGRSLCLWTCILHRLKTAFTIGLVGKRNEPAITDGVTGKIFAIVGDSRVTDSKDLLKEVHAVKVGQWQTLEVDLSRFKGKTVTLLFTADGGKDNQDDFSVFQYPEIDVKLRRRTAEENRALASQLEGTPVPWRAQ